MSDKPASKQIDDIIKQFHDWRGEVMKHLRTIINNAHPAVAEEVKWKMPSNPKGLPVWTHQGIVCLIQTFKNDVKLVFFKGPILHDPDKLFNARLKSSVRAIEFHEGDAINEAGIKALVVEGVEANLMHARKNNKHE